MDDMEEFVFMEDEYPSEADCTCWCGCMNPVEFIDDEKCEDCYEGIHDGDD